MANVVYPPIDFHANTSSPFGFGFALSNPSVGGWPSPTLTPGHTNPGPFQQLASSMNQSSPVRVQKRRYEPEEEENVGIGGQPGRDDLMDRSPTPERAKRVAPKRARIMSSGSKEDLKKGSKESKSKSDDDDVDVGLLLATLPPESLLPLLNSLLNAQPSLKSVILPLIPRPTLDTAIRALSQSAKKLRDNYPYSNSPAPSFFQANSFGFGSVSGNNRTSAFGVSSIGFAMTAQPTVGHSSPVLTNGGMRDDYILSRLRPHINNFVAACISYLPYFSYIPPSASPALPTNDSSPPQSHSNVLQALHKHKSHPSETYLFLSAVTTHILSQPVLAQSSLVPLLVPRLIQEWNAWVDRVDTVVNREGGMFGIEVVRSWEKGLDEFASHSSQSDTSRKMKGVRDKWVSMVGWLVGRNAHHPMEEEL